eukprot:98029_1
MGCSCTAIPKEESHGNEQDTILNGTIIDNNINGKLNHKQPSKRTPFSDIRTAKYHKIPSISTHFDEHKLLIQTRTNRPTETKYIEYIIKNQNHDTECIAYDDCTQLLRIINASKYYHEISSNNTNDKHKFIQFCVDEYKLCLDDYIHLITEHSDDLIQIANDLEIECKFIN